MTRLEPKTAFDIQRQLALGFSVLAILMLVIVGNGLYRLHLINEHLDLIVHNHNYKLQLANTMHEALLVRRSGLYIYAGLEDEFERLEEWEKFNEAASIYLTARSTLLSMQLTEEERGMLKQLDSLTQTGQPIQLQVISLVNSDELEAAKQLLFEKARPLQQDVMDQVSELVLLQNKLNETAARKARASYQSIVSSTFYLSLTVIVVGIITALVVTRRVSQQARETENQRRKFHTLFNSSLDAVMLWDNWKLVQCNKAARETFNLRKLQTQELSIRDLLPARQTNGMKPDTLLESLLVDAEHGEQQLFEYEMTAPDGNRFPAEIRVSSVDIDEHSVIQTVIRDISDRKEAEKKLVWLAYYDQLTGLPNEALFTDRLQMAIDQSARQQQVLAIMTINLSRFSQINESLGWSAGNDLLQITSSRLLEQKQEGDTLARMNADEFMLLLTNKRDDSDLMNVAKKLMKKIKEPLQLEHQDIHMSCRIGIAKYPSDGLTVSELMKNARSAGRMAADLGHGGISLFDATMNAAAYRQMSLANSIPSSIVKGQFYLLYQPKYDLRTDKIMGVEALVRWKHHNYGELMPSEFIPIAEHSAEIIALGEWILREAIACSQRISAHYHDKLEIAVNLSITQCSAPGFIEVVRTLLQSGSARPNIALEFEVTESLALDSGTDIVERLNTLHEMGIRIAIDDFGTGYSSLSHLRELPVDTLKIDKSFIGDLEHNEDHKEIVSMIIMLGHTLGYEVVAEGIESEQQLDYLKSQKCDFAQGFYFSKPVDETTLMKMLGITEVCAIQ